MPRLFVAVVPPDGILDRVAQLNRLAVKGLRWTGREQWHVTLRFLGQVNDVEPVVGALATLSTSPAVSAVIGPAVGRFDQRVLHVPVAGLRALAADVVRATAHLGRPADDRPFVGHLTLARVSKGAKVDLRALTGAAVSGSWTVEQVCLFESKLSPSGARYEVRETIALDCSAVRAGS